MLPREPFVIVLDIVQNKQDIIDCALLVYLVEGGAGIENRQVQHPAAIYECQFSDQGDEPGNLVKLRPYRIWEPTRGKPVKKYFDPRLLKSLLKEARYTIIPKDVANSKLADLMTMYKDLQFNEIKRFDFCSNCRERNGKYIFLKARDAIPLDKDRKKVVCEGCGWSILLERLERKGVKATPGLREILISK
nr:hypothetical protein [Candidatus Sigynarchaeota archaeon]